jgi:hypothetical protein
MADLSKIHAGDTLKIPVEVTFADDAAGAPVRVVGDFMRTVVDGKEEIWISRQLVEAAEHIPAPRVFKRGDWVRLPGEGGPNHGLVTKVRNGTAALGALVTVSWPDSPCYDYYAGDLEPDEAPE